MTSLRAFISRLSTLEIAWSADSVAAATGVPVATVKTYLRGLVVQRVLIETTGGKFAGGPEGSRWRGKKPKTRPGGNAADAVKSRRIYEKLAAEEWHLRRSGELAAIRPEPRMLTGDATTDSDDRGHKATGRANMRVIRNKAMIPLLQATQGLHEVAAALGMCLRSAQRHVDSGKIRVLRVGRAVRVPYAELVRLQLLPATGVV